MECSIIDLDSIYLGIYEKGRNAIQNQKEYIDPMIDNLSDTRMGLTVTIRPCVENEGLEVSENIERFIKELAIVEKEQYYYPKEDFHITLLDLIVARKDFKYTKEQVDACVSVVREAIKGVTPLEIEFRGVVASDAAVLIKGYYQNEFEALRQKLRAEIDKSILVHDERYPAKSCHMTVARFRKRLQNRKELLEKLSEYKNSYFGIIKVNKMELVYHNWFDSKKEILEEFYYE